MAEKNHQNPHYGGGSRDPLDDMISLTEAKYIEKSKRIPLTKTDALSKMCSDIRKIAEVNRYGTIWYPTKSTPSIICKVHSGKVTECHILFINAMHDEFGTPKIPDASMKYRSD